MGQRQALLLATFLTVFGLVTVGAVLIRLATDAENVKQVLAGIDETVVAPTPEAGATPDPQQALQAAILEREAAYQEALRQANAQLEAAYDQLAQVSAGQPSAGGGGTAPAPAPVSAAPVSAPGYAVSPDMAAQIALSVAAGATLAGNAELVDFQGTIAYEVNTSAGLIYVDATTGAVLFNGTTPAPAPAGGGGGATTAATVPIPPPATISEEQALAIAIATVGPGTVEQIKLEHEHGILIWDVKFTNDNEVRIDAYTGAVVRTEIENDNDDDDRDDDDRDDDDRDDDDDRNDDDRDDDDDDRDDDDDHDDDDD